MLKIAHFSTFSLLVLESLSPLFPVQVRYCWIRICTEMTSTRYEAGNYVDIEDGGIIWFLTPCVFKHDSCRQSVDSQANICGMHSSGTTQSTPEDSWSQMQGQNHHRAQKVGIFHDFCDFANFSALQRTCLLDSQVETWHMFSTLGGLPAHRISRWEFDRQRRWGPLKSAYFPSVIAVQHCNAVLHVVSTKTKFLPDHVPNQLRLSRRRFDAQELHTEVLKLPHFCIFGGPWRPYWRAKKIKKMEF